MPGIAGRKSRVRISTVVGGPYVNIQGIRQTSLALDGVVIDDSEFGSEWAQKLQGLKNIKISLQGNRRPTDTTGQGVILGMFTGSTASVFLEYLPDGGTTPNLGFRCEYILANLGLGSEVSGAAEFNADFEGAGTPVLV